jgi:hypothetical protein
MEQSNPILDLTLATGIAVFLCGAGAVSATPVLYDDEADFISEIESLGYEIYGEDFDGPAWDQVRSTDPFVRNSAAAVTNLGVTWMGRSGNLITTNNNWARTRWGIFEDQQVGFSSSELFGVADRTLIAVGGWVNTNPDFGEMTIEVNGQVVDGVVIGSGHDFVGVIDTDGFTEFRVFDTEQHTVWGADDFTYATARAPQVELDLGPVCPQGGDTRLAWALAAPGARVAIVYSPSLGSFTIPGSKPCDGTLLDLDGAGLRVAYLGKSNAKGKRELTAKIPSTLCGGWLQAVDLASCNFSAPVPVE